MATPYIPYTDQYSYPTTLTPTTTSQGGSAFKDTSGNMYIRDVGGFKLFTDTGPSAPATNNYQGLQPAAPAPVQSSTPQTSSAVQPLNPNSTPQQNLDQIKAQALNIKSILDKQTSGGDGTVPSSSAISAMSDNYTPPPQPQTTSLESLYSQMATEMKSLMDQVASYPKLTDTYNNLLSQKDAAGMSLTDYQNMIYGLQAAEIGQPQEVAKEVAGAGFATQSQINALSNAKNAVLDQQVQKYTGLLDIRSNYINQVMSLTKEDQATATANAERAITLTDTLAKFQASIDQNNFNDFIKYQTLQDRTANIARSEISTMYSVGAAPTQDQWTAAGFSGTPPDPKVYSQPYQDSNGNWVQINQNTGKIVTVGKQSLTPSQYSTEMNRLLSDARLGTFGTDINSIRSGAFAAFQAALPGLSPDAQVAAQNQINSMFFDGFEKNISTKGSITDQLNLINKNALTPPKKISAGFLGFGEQWSYIDLTDNSLHTAGSLEEAQTLQMQSRVQAITNLGDSSSTTTWQ